MDTGEQARLAASAVVLVIIGEPFSDTEKQLILAEVAKGFASWNANCTDININDELADIADKASIGVEGLNGEQIIQVQSNGLALDVLVNPQAQTLKNSVKKLLLAPASTKNIIFAGHVIQGSGAWVLQDDTFTSSSLAHILKSIDVETALKLKGDVTLTIHTLAENTWASHLSKADFPSQLKIRVNPEEILNTNSGVLQFTSYLSSFVKVVPLSSLLQASEQFGNISFTRPTLYIFPGCQGDSALFGINGFNLLVNGGYSRRACFWDFARHLDRLDAVLMTHSGTDNIFGLRTVLERKCLENIHPQIGYFYFNAPERIDFPPANDDGSGDTSKKSSLLLNLFAEYSKIWQMSRQLDISPHACLRNSAAASGEPVNLYHKLGHGSLDMYVLNPVSDSKELKDWYQAWSKQATNVPASGPFPLQNVLSVCTLLVWKPYCPDDKIVRILFPGNAPQHKIIEGFEKMKAYDFLRFAFCTARDLAKPVKKSASGKAKANPTGNKGATRASTIVKNGADKGLNNTRVESPMKENKTMHSKLDSKLASPTKAVSPTKPVKHIKDDGEKKEVIDQSRVAEKKFKLATKKVETKNLNEVWPTSDTDPVRGSSSGFPIQNSTLTTVALPADPKSEHVETFSQIEGFQNAAECSDGISVIHTKAESSQELKGISLGKSQELQVQDPMGDQSVSVEQDVQKLQGGGIDLGELENEDEHDRLSNELDPLTPESLPEPNVTEVPPSQTSIGQSEYTDVAESHKQEQLEFELIEQECQPQAELGATHKRTPSPELGATHERTPSPELGATQERTPSPELGATQERTPSPELGATHERTPSPELGATQERTPLPELGATQERTASPESSLEKEQLDSQCPLSEQGLNEFEAPMFSQDGSSSTEGQMSLEQNIQYGIDNASNGRDMGGIQEVDEEEQDDDEEDEDQTGTILDKEALREMGIYDDEDEAGYECNEEEREFQNDGNVIAESHTTLNQDRERNVSESISSERQFEDVDDVNPEGKNCKLSSSFSNKDKATTLSSLDNFELKEGPEANLIDSEDRDSLDGGTPDDEDVDDLVVSKVNGLGHQHVEKADIYGLHRRSESWDGDENIETEVCFDPDMQWGKPLGLPSPPPLSKKLPPEGRKSFISPNSSDKNLGTAGKGVKDSKPDSKKPVNSVSVGTKSRQASSVSKTAAITNRPSPVNAKTLPLPAFTPFYLDLTYLPNHADPLYLDVEFFKRIRARYYVVSALSPNLQVLDSLLEAKATWEQKDLEVTIIPTYDNETLRHWMGLNTERLQELRVDLKPAVNRCTIQLQDLETSLPAYRLEV